MANSYLRFPNNFFMGTRTLTLEERGAFNDLLDLYIARDGDLPDQQRQRSYDLAIDPRVWTRIRKQLIEAGKVEIRDGNIEPTGGDKTLATSLARSIAAKDAADSRWRKNLNKVSKLKETTYAGAYATAMPIKTRHKSIDKQAVLSISLKKQFDEWYQFYPRKVGVGAAKKQFKKSIKIADLNILVEAVKAFAVTVADQDKKFIPHPATWLSDERWTDDQSAINPSETRKQQGNPPGNSSITSAARRFVSGERM